MVYVTCAMHGLHRTCEKIRGQYGIINKILSKVKKKKIVLMTSSRLQIFKTYNTNVPIAPESIITRQGTRKNVHISILFNA